MPTEKKKLVPDYLAKSFVDILAQKRLDYPSIFINQLVNVQPMAVPAGLITYLKHKYLNPKKFVWKKIKT